MELSPTMTVREILRLRPRAIEALDIAVGPEFWNYQDRPFSELCREKSLHSRTLLHSIATLPGPIEEGKWSRAPIYDVVDHLVAEHGRFRDRDIPGIEKQLAECDPTDFPSEFPLEEFRLRFHSFKIDFLLHMNEEEEYLFPKALRTEACLRHPGMAPEPCCVSVDAYSGSILRDPEMELKQMLKSLSRMAAPETGPSTPALDRIHNRVVDLDDRVSRHADLEVQVLLPKVLEMERTLKRRIEDRELTGTDLDRLS